jgi:hypothetical protein
MEQYITEIVLMALVMTLLISIITATWVIKGTSPQGADY